MFNDYFEKLGNDLIKTCRPGKGKQAKTGAAKGGKKAPAKAMTHEAFDRAKFGELLAGIVPTHLKLGAAKIADSGGYTIENVDYVIYREAFRNMDAMLNAVPSDLVYGTVFVNTGLTAVTLADTLTGVANMKKIDRFADAGGSGRFIPAFILAMDMHMAYQDLKNLILDFYVSRSLDNYFEFDIMAVMNRGIVVKDWREKRSFKILDTGEDTMKWFFILLNEYLDVDKDMALDLRKYVKETTRYKEY